MRSACSRRLPAVTADTRTPHDCVEHRRGDVHRRRSGPGPRLYTDKLGFEVRTDACFGEHDEMRWLDVAQPGSRARLALTPPMGGEPGGSEIAVEAVDVLGEQARLSALGGINLDSEPMRTPALR